MSADPAITTTVSTTPRLVPGVLRGPAGPLVALFGGFPLWWALGLSTFIFAIVALPMAWILLRRRTFVVPRGFGLWLGFLAWMLLGITMLAADAPGADPGGFDAGRLMVFGYRGVMYIAATIICLYIVNLSERELPTRRVCRLLALMFVITVAGGLLGVTVPDFEFRSLMELVLPTSIATNDFVSPMIHPAAANVTAILGYEEARPIAPFAFSNSWGANLSVYLPFFLLTWFGKHAGWRRWVAPLILAAAIIPIIYSLNRVLWLALALGAAYLAIRFALRGRMLGVQAIGAGLILTVVVVTMSPLGHILEQRLDTPHSDSRRAQLATETVTSVTTGSPLLGFGSTRDVAGSFSSIAGGATPDCPACGVPPMGTQGHIWLVMFSQGFVGLLLFLGFFGRRFLAHWRDPSPLPVTGTGVLVFFFLEMFFYDLSDAPLITVMITIALLWRARQPPPEPWPSTSDRLTGVSRVTEFP